MDSKCGTIMKYTFIKSHQFWCSSLNKITNNFASAMFIFQYFRNLTSIIVDTQQKGNILQPQPLVIAKTDK